MWCLFKGADVDGIVGQVCKDIKKVGAYNKITLKSDFLSKYTYISLGNKFKFSAILAHYALGKKTCAKTKLVLISKH